MIQHQYKHNEHIKHQYTSYNHNINWHNITYSTPKSLTPHHHLTCCSAATHCSPEPRQKINPPATTAPFRPKKLTPRQNVVPKSGSYQKKWNDWVLRRKTWSDLSAKHVFFQSIQGFQPQKKGTPHLKHHWRECPKQNCYQPGLKRTGYHLLSGIDVQLCCIFVW